MQEIWCAAVPHCHVVATGEAVVWGDISLQGCLYRGPFLLAESYNTDAPKIINIKKTTVIPIRVL